MINLFTVVEYYFIFIKNWNLFFLKGITNVQGPPGLRGPDGDRGFRGDRGQPGYLVHIYIWSFIIEKN
jgi:hypothetical protein